MIIIKENFAKYSYTENEMNFEKVCSFINSQLPFNGLLPKDILKITIKVSEDTIFENEILFNDFNFEDIKQKMLDIINTEDNKSDIEEFNCAVIYNINKNPNLDTFSIYDFNAFMDYLTNSESPKTLTNLLNLFKPFSLNEDKVCIHSHENFILETNLFTTKGYNIPKEVSNEQRDNKYDAWNFFSNNQNLVDFNLLPEDFINTDTNSQNLSTKVKELQFIITKIANFLILSFLVDFVRLDENKLTLRINERYRRFKEDIYFNSTTIENEDILKRIYNWVFFSSKNEIEDRLEITKNVLSRKLFLSNDILTLKDDSYYSIIDAHKIYLKDNVTQYFEVKKEVAGMITEITSKSSTMIQNLSSTFKFQSGTLITYFISLFIFNSLSSGEFEVFNKSNYIISITLLLYSGYSLHLALKQYEIEENLLNAHFDSIKENYREDFDSDHLDTLFNTTLLTSSTENLKKSKKLFKKAWLIEIIGLFFLITLIVFHSEIVSCIKSFIGFIK